ncbi:MAG TPA: DUF2325 domain-containing protein [Calditrichaeota bacterium]|nr:DUF2325 domain-containing protein [Calditrichota bacterium]
MKHSKKSNYFEWRERMRKNIWEIDKSFHCPLIGLCLNISEQRRILKKAGYKVKKLNDPNCHEILVDAISEDSPLAKRVQKFLDTKYKDALERWDNLIDTEYLTAWRASIDGEQMAADFYGMVTRPDFLEREHELFTDSAHILSFYKWQQMQKLQKAYSNLQNQYEYLEQKIKESRSRNLEISINEKALRQKLKKMQQTNAILQKQLDEKEKQTTATHKRSEDETDMQLRLDKQAAIIHRLKVENGQLKSQNSGMANLLAREKQVNQILANEISALAPKNKIEQCENCPNNALFKKRVLLVGGITKLRNYYRDVVERFEGVFEYHDGYIRNGNDNLDELVRRADYVLCPVDVNSHRACLNVKKFCNKWDKPYHMLRNAGISSVAMALTKIAQAGV